MTINYVKVYQSVKFNKKMETYFSAFDTANNRDCNMELIENLGVKISKKGAKTVIIPFANIAQIELLEEKKKQPKSSSKSLNG